MDRYRVKQYRSWNDTSKLLRQLSAEKHLVVDPEERSQLQRCLDLLQKSIKVNSAQGMIERLDTITRQLGLKLTKDQKRGTDRKPVEYEVFISSDMFYVEVTVEGNGHVSDVKQVAHHGDPVSCPELCEVLQKNDFVTFTTHLEGLIAIYQLDCEVSKKQKAYLALQALESDLSTLAELQNFVSDARQLIFKSPVGVLLRRRGGFPMQLTFFVSPYDFVDIKTGMIPITVDNVVQRQLGQSVSISIENSSQHKLQTGSLITNIDGKSMPTFGALTQLNSVTLLACFTMKLSNPLPIDMECLKKIQSVTGIEIPSQQTESLINLITKRKNEKDGTSNSFHVKLPDQNHTYHIESGNRMGALVTSIPFTHPTHVPQVLCHLRQQCLFNELISSCVRDQPTAGPDNHVFELKPNSLTSLCISYEHPLDCESLVTLELGLTDVMNLRCKSFFSSSSESNQFQSDEVAAKVLQKSLSIPVLMRSIIKKAQSMKKPTPETPVKPVVAPSFLSNGTEPQREKFENEVSTFENNVSVPPDLFDLDTLAQDGALGLHLMADDCGPGNFYQQQQAPNQNNINNNNNINNQQQQQQQQQQRKRPREEENFLERAPGFPNQGSVGGPKALLDSGSQQNRISSSPPPGDPLANFKRQRIETGGGGGGVAADGNAILGSMALPGATASVGQNSRDSKNLLAGGDSAESSPASLIYSDKKDRSSPNSASKGDDRRSNSSSSRDKDKRKEKEKNSSKDGGSSSKSSSSSRSSSKEKDYKNSSKSNSSKDREKEKSNSKGNSSSGLSAIVDKLHQNVKSDISNISPNKYSSSEGQFTVKSSSSAQGIKLTINKARTSESGSRSKNTSSSSSSSSSKHNSRDSPKPRSLSSSPSHKRSSPSWKASPKHNTIMPPPESNNAPMDLIEQRLRALHGDDTSIGSPFDSSRSPMGPSSVGSSRPSPLILEDDNMIDDGLCGVKNNL